VCVCVSVKINMHAKVHCLVNLFNVY